jgi:hypothetical protein
MSKSIFTFDHTKEDVSEAINVSKTYLDELQYKVKDVIHNLKCDDVNETLIERSPSEIIEATLNNFSYSELVILSSFFLVNYIQSMEDKATEAAIKEMIESSGNIPEGFEDFLKNLRNNN